MVVAVIVVVVPGCGRNVTPNAFAVPEAQTRCDLDDDCVLVESACDCANGGGVVSVSVDAADDVAADLDSALCDAVVSDDPGCDAADAVCVESTCQLLFNG